MENNMLRKENILILPYNTMKIVDVIVQLELFKLAGNKMPPLEEVIFRVVTRTHKDLSVYNDCNQELIDQMVKLDYKRLYELSPGTEIVDIIHILSLQKFVNNIYVLFDDDRLVDNTNKYTNIYYDGTLDELINVINKYEITAIVMDDVEILKDIYDKDKLLLENKTIMIPKYGYNYYRNKNGDLRLKYYNDYFSKVTHLEIGTPDIIKFSKDILNKYIKKGK